MRTVSVLGATGSVGDSTFKVLEELPDTHRVVSMVAHSNDARMVELARRFRPELVGLVDRAAAGRAREALAPSGIEVIEGDDVAVEALRATSPDLVLAAITGAAGLASSLETVTRGASLLLANKEALVMAGNLITRAAAASGAAIVPVDSEHSAIFQAIHGEDARAVRRIFLTASGGPFVDREAGSFADVRPEDALRHPTWEMGRKITIDSATMMNKALEIVEARWLFDVPAEAIEVLVHRQSIVHSMVEFVDGSILAQLGTPSMTVPVRHALGYPERVETSSSYFDIEQFSALSFEPPDAVRFPALDLGHAVARTLGLSGTALNAANEVAVAAFLDGATRFDRISETAARVLDALEDVADPDLEQILAADAWAREEATRCLSR